ncbi:MAG: TraR/DksA family transcriptional regulator, partial [Gammaproteobacteria bacterium]|nr:TraR/DksA family transcriptional regulator [Gammaproteobacteria bacterium]
MSIEMERLRKKLMARREELQKRVQKITDDVRHTSGPLSSDFAEQAVER